MTVLTQGLFISESKTQGIDACASSLPCILMLLNALVRGGYETSKCIDNNKHCTCYNDAYHLTTLAKNQKRAEHTEQTR